MLRIIFVVLISTSALAESSDGIDLQDVAGGEGGVMFQGVDEHLRWSAVGRVSGSGDLNGDGYTDVAIPRPFADVDAILDAGRVDIVFGGPQFDQSRISALRGSAAGFQIVGFEAEAVSGYSTAICGDVNGDGIDDIAVSNNSRTTYVVFGKREQTPAYLVDVSAGIGGFSIVSDTLVDEQYRRVNRAGDVNGDGLSDVLVSVWGTSAAGFGCYVVFGKSDTNPVYLEDIATGIGGIYISVPVSDAAGAGDFNGDGLDDVVIGYTPYLESDEFPVGQVYVVYGKNDTNVVDLPIIEAGVGGFVASGVEWIDRAGSTVDAAGDVNGDGFGDIVVGAPTASRFPDRRFTGVVYVIFGAPRTDSFNLGLIEAGIGGFAILGGNAWDGARIGLGVAGIGDFNGDGLDDVMVGSPEAFDTPDRLGGRCYVVFGRTTTDPVCISGVEVGLNGVQLLPAFARDYMGEYVSSAGDFNADGFADAMVRTRVIDTIDFDPFVETYVVFGRSFDTRDLIPHGVQGFTIEGPGFGVEFGQSVANAGDVNGDGIDDIVLGTTEVSEGKRDPSGEVCIVFGKESLESAYVTDLRAGIGGFRIFGGVSAQVFGNEGTGYAVGGAGDVNGDGLDDVIIGSPYVGTVAQFRAGLVFVVFGRTSNQDVYLDDILAGNGGFAIVGDLFDGNAGTSVEIAGDVNGDGLDDIVLGAPMAGNTEGKAYVVFGKQANTDPVSLSDIAAGIGGFVIHGVPLDASRLYPELTGMSVSGNGDVNGDGLDDLLIGMEGLFSDQRYQAAESCVVYGKANSDPVYLAQIATGVGGYYIHSGPNREAIQFFAYPNANVSILGDVNNDGIDDLGIGWWGYDEVDGANSGRVYVVFGSSNQTGLTTEDLESNTHGFHVAGFSDGEFAGHAISRAGDIDGDGYADFIIGAPGQGHGQSSDPGAAYLIFGKASFEPVDVRTLDSDATGVRMPGVFGGARFGFDVAGGGDYNGDGYPDVVVTVPGAVSRPSGYWHAGQAYVLFGGPDSLAANAQAPAPRSSSSSGSACFIATAAYGTPLARELDRLRSFRDETLIHSSVGSAAADFYYRVSPPAAGYVSQHRFAREFVRLLLWLFLHPILAASVSALVVAVFSVGRSAVLGFGAQEIRE